MIYQRCAHDYVCLFFLLLIGCDVPLEQRAVDATSAVIDGAIVSITIEESSPDLTPIGSTTDADEEDFASVDLTNAPPDMAMSQDLAPMCALSQALCGPAIGAVCCPGTGVCASTPSGERCCQNRGGMCSTFVECCDNFNGYPRGCLANKCCIFAGGTWIC